jgi:hypothetical protein
MGAAPIGAEVTTYCLRQNRQAAIRHRRFVIHTLNQRSADIAVEVANFYCIPDER